MLPLCNHCGQPVSGSSITALGKTWHPEHFLCAGCGQPLRKQHFTLVEGKPYHAACYLAFQAPRCSYCSQPIEGSYTVVNGQNYHSSCYYEHVVPRCVYCQKPLTGRYRVDGWGNKYCEEHQAEYPHCSFCGRLIPPHQQKPGWEAGGSLRCLACCAT